MEFKSLHKILDLEYYEGPFMSLFEDKKGNYYIYKWLDVNADSHRWLIYQTTLPNVLSYVAKSLEALSLVKMATDQRYFVVDIHPDLSYSNVITYSLQTLPEEYQPYPDVFFDESDCLNLQPLFELSKQKKIAA